MLTERDIPGPAAAAAGSTPPPRSTSIRPGHNDSGATPSGSIMIGVRTLGRCGVPSGPRPARPAAGFPLRSNPRADLPPPCPVSAAPAVAAATPESRSWVERAGPVDDTRPAPSPRRSLAAEGPSGLAEATPNPPPVNNPIPNATARPPTRPTYFDAPIPDNPRSNSRHTGGASKNPRPFTALARLPQPENDTSGPSRHEFTRTTYTPAAKTQKDFGIGRAEVEIPRIATGVPASRSVRLS